MSELNEKKVIAKEEFAANEIREFCRYVMHPDSDLHKDADNWIKERLQSNGVTTGEKQCNLPVVSQRSELFFAVLKWAKQADLEYPDDMLLDDFEKFTAKHSGQR